MMIWEIRGKGIAPQHIGNVAANEYGDGLVAQAHKARHTSIKVIATATKGNEVTAYAFSNFPAMKDFAQRNSIKLENFVLR